MSAVSLEERVAKLEAKVSRLAQDSGSSEMQEEDEPWWRRIIGVYKGDPAFEEADRLGREWRESFRPSGDEIAPI